MATYTHENLDSGNCRVIKVSVAGSETSQNLEFGQWADASVQVYGNFAAGSISIEGSNDGVNFSVLNDAQGNALTVNTNKIEQILESTRFKRVVATSVTAVDVTFFLLRAQQLRV